MNLEQIVDDVAKHRAQNRSLLFAISGIDGSGKTTISKTITNELEAHGLRTALINLDAWHNPPEIRFSKHNAGLHFYNHAFRFDELFRLLILPLKENREIRLTARLTRLPENDFFFHSYNFSNINVIILEGIFLLKQELRRHYDFALWIDCTFEKALDRAIVR